MPPELLFPEKFGLRACEVSKQTYIYAFGMAIYEVLTGRPPPFGVEKCQHPEIILRALPKVSMDNSRDMDATQASSHLNHPSL